MKLSSSPRNQHVRELLITFSKLLIQVNAGTSVEVMKEHPTSYNISYIRKHQVSQPNPPRGWMDGFFFNYLKKPAWWLADGIVERDDKIVQVAGRKSASCITVGPSSRKIQRIVAMLLTSKFFTNDDFVYHWLAILMYLSI